jgi:hypothetical protein
LILNQKIPTASGFSQVTSNVGKIQNKGLEILLNTVNVATSNFTWNTTLTFTKNNNKLLSLYGEGQTVDKGNKLFVGYPISYETACKFFNLPEDTLPRDLDRQIQDAGLVLQDVDKGQCILGLSVDVSSCYDEFIGVDDALMMTLQRKKDVIQRCKKACIDLSDFMLQPLGEEATQRVSNPEPYLVSV